jgi:hypothetical protein
MVALCAAVFCGITASRADQAALLSQATLVGEVQVAAAPAAAPNVSKAEVGYWCSSNKTITLKTCATNSEMMSRARSYCQQKVYPWSYANRQYGLFGKCPVGGTKIQSIVFKCCY